MDGLVLIGIWCFRSGTPFEEKIRTYVQSGWGGLFYSFLLFCAFVLFDIMKDG